MRKVIGYKVFRLSVLIILLGLNYSCKPVKEFQKTRLNDSEMQLVFRKSEKFDNNFLLYREGAAGGNGGKTGGGCGCN